MMKKAIPAYTGFKIHFNCLWSEKVKIKYFHIPYSNDWKVCNKTVSERQPQHLYHEKHLATGKYKG